MEFYEQAPGIAGGDKKKARAMADEILRLDAARGYLAQASLAQREKETAKLEGLYLKAVEADPRSYPARMSLVNFYASESQKKYDLAELQTAVRQKPDLDAARKDLKRLK